MIHKKKNVKNGTPEIRQLEGELRRERYKRRYSAVLKSTVYTLITVAAIAVLVATLWMPVLQIYGNSMTPTLTEGDIVLTVKNSDFNQGDIIAFYYGNKLLVKRCIAGPGSWVNIDDDGNVYVDGQLIDEPYPMDWYMECIDGSSLFSNVIYVAREGDMVVGFVRFYLWETNSTVSGKQKMLTIDDIGVDISLRNRGIGQEMMSRLRELAKSRDCSGIRLYVDAENESAYQYYLKCGFHVRNIGMGLSL